MRVLVTGFDPFNKDLINPSIEAVKLLPDKIANFEIIKKELETKYYQSSIQLNDYIDEYHPDFVILVGQAAKRDSISLEKIALNMYDADILDNAGINLKHTIIDELADKAYFSNVDIESINNKLLNNNIPSKISFFAGTFVCNSTYFKLLHKINSEELNIKTLFVHIPLIENQISNYPENTFYMELSEIVKALTFIIESLI